MLVYTAIYSGYDNLKQPTVKDSSLVRWQCITDTYRARGVWKPRTERCTLSPVRCARRAKILYHLFYPKEDITIWHGGNVQLRGDLTKLAALVDNADIAVLKHDQRDCVYDEAEACKQFGKGDPDVIDAQMARYRGYGYPAKNGLHTAFLIIRRNTKMMRKLATMWWQEVKRGSHRDQLSLDYCLWRMRIEPVIILGNIYEGPFHKRTGLHR